MNNIRPNQYETDGVVLQYTTEGEGIPTLVIGSHIYYPRTFSQNLRHHLQMVFMDHRAFAQSTTHQSFELANILEDIEGLRKTLGLGKVLIVGHSIQALIALEYAKQYPQSVMALVMIASSPTAGPKVHSAADQYFQESVNPERKMILANNLKTLESEISTHPENAFVIRMLKFAPMIWYDSTYDASALWQDVKLNPEGAAIVWGPMFSEYDLKPGIDKMKCPVFLALGRYDYWNPPHLWESVRSCFHNLTIRIFEKSGHTPQLEEAIAFDRELLTWLQKQAS